MVGGMGGVDLFQAVAVLFPKCRVGFEFARVFKKCLNAFDKRLHFDSVIDIMGRNKYRNGRHTLRRVATLQTRQHDFAHNRTKWRE